MLHLRRISAQGALEQKPCREMLPNTAPFDVTGHPAMSVPCGMSDGLPGGMMLVAKHFDEMSIHRAASAFEKAGIGRT
jgi:amidase